MTEIIRLRKALAVLSAAWGHRPGEYCMIPIHAPAIKALEAYCGKLPGHLDEPDRKEVEKWLSVLKQLVEDIEAGLSVWNIADYRLPVVYREDSYEHEAFYNKK